MDQLPTRSNTTISKPILFPSNEISQHNGFAWTKWGIVIQSSNTNNTVLKGGALNWLGTQQ
jgi:hypothetical protein